MSRAWARIWLPVAALGATLVTPAFADMGRAPAGPGEHYLSIEGGYLHQEGADVIGYGVAPSLTAPIFDVTVSPSEGWFAGAMLGWDTGRQILPSLPFTRIEGYALFGEVDDDAGETAPAGGFTAIKSADGDPLAVGGVDGATSIERRFVEGGLRFEGDSVRTEGGSLKDEQPVERHSITWVLNPFIRWTGEEHDTVVSCLCPATRSAEVDTVAYGAVLAMEPEFLLRPGVSLVGRAGIGLYGYNADGDFHSASGAGAGDPFASDFSDSESGIGFRGQLGAGLKFWLSQRSILDVFAEADYFSDVGTAAMSDNQPTNTNSSHVDTEDLWELRVGARLTIGLDGN